MTASELKEEFNIRYNNAIEGSVGLDDYEISVYLSHAQTEIVKSYYDLSINVTTAFELNEKCRRALSPFVKSSDAASFTKDPSLSTDNSYAFTIDSKCMYIIQESIVNADKSQIIKVLPVTHDEFMTSYSNPFRKPSDDKAYRLDIGNVIEIIWPKESVSGFSYIYRYVKRPDPILVSSFNVETSEFYEMGLKIEGKDTQTDSGMPDEFHRELVNKAVELATLDYREPSLQGRLALNKEQRAKAQ